MSPKVSRRGRIAPFHVMEVMRAANAAEAAGARVIHLEVGQPSTPAPTKVIAAAREALGIDRLAYTEALGVPALRARIARHYRDTYGVSVPADRIVITVGASGAFLLAFLAAFDAGDRVAVAEPGYPGYRNNLAALDVTVVPLPVGASTRFQPTPEMFADLAGPLHGLVVASPANPTGTMLDRDALAALAAACRARRARLVSDEIYHGITYGARAVSALEVDENAIVINSFSKYFSMTGWRLGWMVVPEDLLRSVECLAQNFVISPPTLSQIAAVSAFECTPELEANVARYAANRAILLRELPRAGLDRLAPADGAFYIYADVSRFSNDSQEFCRRLLVEAGVAATPGVDFDAGRGHLWARFSFAGATEDVEEAAKRLGAWLR